jgi:hypothetical protein
LLRTFFPVITLQKIRATERNNPDRSRMKMEYR